MRILDKSNSIDEVVDLIISKARYQKVVLCLDETSDMDFVNAVSRAINKYVAVMTYYYNKSNISSFHNMVDNGTRVVLYNVSAKHFYKLQTNNNYVLNIFLPQSSFVLPYISNVESVYGENLLVCDTSLKDYTTLLVMYEMALHDIWGKLIQNTDVDTSVFKSIDDIANGKVDFCVGLNAQKHILIQNVFLGYQEIEEEELPYYIYLRMCAICKMLESVICESEQYVDFYKTELSVGAIEKAHNLLVKYDIVQTLKLHSVNLIRINNAILNRAKIIIKKHFNCNNIKLNNLNKIIKKQSKELNMEILGAIPCDENGNVNFLEDIPDPTFDVYKCPRCGRLMIFGEYNRFISYRREE